jgi:hypothetical protein
LRSEELDKKIKTTCICPYFLTDDKDELNEPKRK